MGGISKLISLVENATLALSYRRKQLILPSEKIIYFSPCIGSAQSEALHSPV